jgi:hypothetical protein
MKALFTLLVLSCSLSSNAITIKVDDWKYYLDMERSFHLITQSVSQKVRLDCQSFLQGIMIGEYEDTALIMLDTQTCQDLSQRIQKSISRHSSHCLEVEDILVKDYRCR